MVDLKLYIVTFNCGRVLIEPDAFGRHFFDGWEDPSSIKTLPDLLVLNLQEIAPISYGFLGNNFVKPYFDRFRQAIQIATPTSAEGGGESYKYFNLLSRHVGLTAIMLFVRDDLVNEIQTLNVAEVGVGLSEMGNKGAIGARLGWKGSDAGDLVYTTFVSAHLAPFEEEIERRNQDYIDIAGRLVFTSEDAREWKKARQSAEAVPLLARDSSDMARSQPTTSGMYSNDTYLFFAGDLNYRTGITKPRREDSDIYPQPRKDIKDALHYSHLLEKDQLTQQLHDRKALHGLTEQQIDFPPTYKYHLNKDKSVLIDKDIEEWNWAEHRWPSWCDRILYSASQVQAGKYSALPLFRTSDHRPVSLSVSVPLKQLPSDSDLARQGPVALDEHYKSRREAARRKELVVGIAAYLGLTWEGNSMLLGTVLIVLGSIWISKSMS